MLNVVQFVGRVMAAAIGVASMGAATTGAGEDRASWDRLAAIDGASCRERLKELKVVFRSMPDRTEPSAEGCGIPHGVVVSAGPTGIRYSPPLQVDCSMALELPEIERKLQALAQEHLESAVRRVGVFGTYSCRKVRGGFSGRLSEHAIGNAIDFGTFTPKRGTVVSVARHFRPFEDPPDEKSRFLRAVFDAFRSYDGFTYVIGPENRADHHDHIHVDRAEPWWRIGRIGG